jgi:hypothetical protein
VGKRRRCVGVSVGTYMASHGYEIRYLLFPLPRVVGRRPPILETKRIVSSDSGEGILRGLSSGT